MAKATWGTKRHCHGCGTRFYDLSKPTIHCPKCGITIDPEAVFRTRKGKGSALEHGSTFSKSDSLLDETLDAEIDPNDDAPLMEDASDLGDDDMSEVIDHVEKRDDI